MEAWLLANWKWILVGFYVAEKIVKVTPTKYDDILIDGIKYSIQKLVGKTT